MMNFLDHYNDELRQLRDAGARFSKEHPQVAGALGLHPDTVTDPFVERLLEGVAYLSARVQTRLDRECAEFAQQALGRIAPLFMAATPAITSFAFHTDLDSPETFRGSSIARGTLISARLPGRKQPVMFSTARQVTLLPLRLAQAECSRSLDGLPVRLAQALASAQAVIRLRFELEGTATLSGLHREGAGFEPLHLSLAGDLPRAYALQQALLASTGAWYATVQGKHGETVLTLPMSGIRLSGIDAEDALLPEDFGALPGLRLMREYFAQPTRLLGVYLDVLAALSAEAPSARAFDLYFALKQVPTNLVGEVDAQQFRLYATPAVNLYPKRFDPVPYNADLTEQWIPVDRIAPAAFHLWGLTEVRACEGNGVSHTARAVLDSGGYGAQERAVRYSLRRENAMLADGARRDRDDPLASHDLISITAGDALSLDGIASIAGKALVVDRGWRPAAVLDAELSLLEPAALKRIECLWPASVPRGIPSPEACWEAVSRVGQHPLALHGDTPQEVTARIVEQLRLASDDDVLDRQRLDSLRSAYLSMRFVPAGRLSPLALVRATHIEIDIAAAAHSDRGAWLFGRMLAQAMAEAATHNEGTEIVVRLDGEIASTHTTTACRDGRLR
jgi:type VI secretion system protein ImpG